MKPLAKSEDFYGEEENEEVDKKKMYRIHQNIKKALENGGLKEDGSQEKDVDTGNRECRLCNLF